MSEENVAKSAKLAVFAYRVWKAPRDYNLGKVGGRPLSPVEVRGGGGVWVGRG